RLSAQRPVGHIDTRHIKTIGRAGVPAPAVHASDQLEFRRIDVTFSRIDHVLICNVYCHNPAENHRAVHADLDDDQTFTFERNRTLRDARRLHLRRRCWGETRFGELVDALTEVDRGDVHLLGKRIADQIDDELTGATDIAAGVLDVAWCAAAD